LDHSSSILLKDIERVNGCGWNSEGIIAGGIAECSVKDQYRLRPSECDDREQQKSVSEELGLVWTNLTEMDGPKNWEILSSVGSYFRMKTEIDENLPISFEVRNG
jgi:hypothetical protein